jgi:hypothetical protein
LGICFFSSATGSLLDGRNLAFEPDRDHVSFHDLTNQCVRALIVQQFQQLGAGDQTHQTAVFSYRQGILTAVKHHIGRVLDGMAGMEPVDGSIVSLLNGIAPQGPGNLNGRRLLTSHGIQEEGDHHHKNATC